MTLKDFLRNFGITLKTPILDISYKPNQGVTPTGHLCLSMQNGSIPPLTLPAGYEGDGTPLYIARAWHENGLHIGKVRTEFKAAHIPYDGKVVHKASYDVYVGPLRWSRASDGAIPTGAIVAGHEADGEPLYVARAEIEKGVHIGKVRREFGAALIPYGDKEIPLTPYEILITE